MRHILVARGAKRVVPLLAFVEVTVWLLAMTQIMSNLDNLAYSFAWAVGFAAGTYCGIVLEEKLALGFQLVRVFSHRNPEELVAWLREHHYAVTTVTGSGERGRVEVILVAVARSKVRRLTAILREFDPSLFVTLEDLRTVQAGIFTVKELPEVVETIVAVPNEPTPLPANRESVSSGTDEVCLPVSPCGGGMDLPNVKK
jgi:uncharacterized protein YebE (UPF0316 family)